MGVDWISCRVRAGAELSEVERLIDVVASTGDHGLYQLRRNGQATEGSRRASARLSELLDIDVDIDTGAGTGTGAGRHSPIRASSLARNPTLPLEWRDEALSVLLPTRLLDLVNRMRVFRRQVLDGDWAGYQYDLYLHAQASSEFDREEIWLLQHNAEESLTRSNAWATKPRHVEARAGVLQADLHRRWMDATRAVPIPYLDAGRRTDGITEQQRQVDRSLASLRDEAATLIRDWNRSVPTNRKLRTPQRWDHGEHLDKAGEPWLETFLDWCDHLASNGYGVYLR